MSGYGWIAVFALTVFLLVAAACTSESPPAAVPDTPNTPAPTATATPYYPTATPYSTHTPAPTATPTRLPPSPVPTLASIDTPVPMPVPMPTPTATPTPIPPVSINSDCVGCHVVAPGAGGTQQVMKAYAEWPSAGRHPDSVLLVACNRGERVAELGQIMGARGGTEASSDISVIGPSGFVADLAVAGRGSCYAITAKYDGEKQACIEIWPGSCRFGNGQQVEILGFKVVGESTEISTSQYQTLLKYSRATQYQVE